MSMLQENQSQRPNIYQVVKAVSQLRGVECPIRNVSVNNDSNMGQDAYECYVDLSGNAFIRLSANGIIA